MKTDQIALSVY